MPPVPPPRADPRPTRPGPAPHALDRRSFFRRAGLVGGAGALTLALPGLLAACSSSSDDGDAQTLDLTGFNAQLVGLFNYQGGYLVTGAPQRAVFTIASAEGPPALDGPPTLTARLARQGVDKGEFVLERHAEGTPIGYYPLFTTFDEPGIWSLTSEIDGAESTQSFQVDAPSAVALRQPGQAMVAVTTPTTVDAQGVTPICTRDPQCPLHERTLSEVLAAGQPTALLIGTPRYCQTAVCGPVLDTLMAEVANHPEMAFVHAEVYVNPAASPDPGSGGTTAAIDAYGLTFEPSLFLAGADGIITSRLDNVWDTVELREALASATA
jgi:hypothetical protein